MDSTVASLLGALPQQGPGSDACSLRALSLVSAVSRVGSVLDVGCGTGRQTLVLLEHSGAAVTAVDIRRPSLELLGSKAGKAGFASRLMAVQASMAALPFRDARFDLVWAEGSAYILGFEAAIAGWKSLLRPGGSIALTDLTWFTSEAAGESREYFRDKYPDMATVAQRVRIIERSGFHVVGHFPIPAEAWWRDYYHPLERELERAGRARDASRQLVEFARQCRAEIDMFRKHSGTYGYAFFVLNLPDAAACGSVS